MPGTAEPAAGAWGGVTEASGDDPTALMERLMRRLMMVPTDGRGRTRGSEDAAAEGETKADPAWGDCRE